jgi:hypothetical protein
MTCTPMRGHAYEIHTYERHVHEMHAYEMHAMRGTPMKHDRSIFDIGNFELERRLALVIVLMQFASCCMRAP